MAKKGITKDHIDSAFVKEVTSLFPAQIVKIVFFGSRAKGIAGPESDYDFLIVLKDKGNEIIDGLYDVVTDFLINYGVDISLKIYREDEFHRLASYPTPFIGSILNSGKELWPKKSGS